MGGKQAYCLLPSALAPCSWSCGFGWCLAEGRGTGDQRHLMDLYCFSPTARIPGNSVRISGSDVCGSSALVGGMRSTEWPCSTVYITSGGQSALTYTMKMNHFYRATICVGTVFAVVRCLSVVCLLRWCIVSTRQTNLSAHPVAPSF